MRIFAIIVGTLTVIAGAAAWLLRKNKLVVKYNPLDMENFV